MGEVRWTSNSELPFSNGNLSSKKLSVGASFKGAHVSATKSVFHLHCIATQWVQVIWLRDSFLNPDRYIMKLLIIMYGLPLEHHVFGLIHIETHMLTT